MTEYDEQKKTVKDLQECLADAEFQILESEKLRKMLHNTILVLISFMVSHSLCQRFWC